MAVELRVHGVTGTPAEDMLDRPLVTRVAGDGNAGFYRPRPEYGGTTGPGGAQLEAYRWGNLTSGAAARAFWLLLLPFTLANVVPFLRPPSKGMGRLAVRGLCRLFALTMTATFTLVSIGVALDLLAWQCAAPGSRCVTRRPWLNWFFTGFFAPPGRRLALAALIPIAVVGVLWYLARRTWARYESYHRPSHNPDGDGLATPTFWDGRAQVSRLRLLHIATAFAVIDAMLLFVLLRHDLDEGAFAGVRLILVDPSVVIAGAWVLVAVTAVLLLACLVLLFTKSMVDRDANERWTRPASLTMRFVALALTGLTLGYALLPRAAWVTTGPLPGYADTVTILFASQTTMIVVLTMVIARQRRHCPGALFAGFGAPVVASISLGIGGAFSAGVSYRVADFLDGGAAPSPAVFEAESELMRLQPPVSYQWAAFGFLVMMIAVLVGGLWTWQVTRRSLRRAARLDTDAEFPGERQRDPGRAREIDKKAGDAGLTDRVGRPFGVVWVLLGVVAIAATGLAIADIGPVQLAASGSTAARVLHLLLSVGTYIISFSALGLVLLGVQTYRSTKVRRTVGVIWDLATFWPRAIHPLAPPCYAERVVPELVLRANYLATEQGGVVLSGHSQGSVLCAATVLQLPAAARRHTALLTYGSPLRRLYARAFPAYLNDEMLARVGDALADSDGSPRWRNLWRRTDPIGGEVGLGDQRMPDPPSFHAMPGDTVAPAVAGHSGYQAADGYAEVVTELLDRLPGAAAEPVTVVPTPTRPRIDH